jgi:hypothetical protein
VQPPTAAEPTSAPAPDEAPPKASVLEDGARLVGALRHWLAAQRQLLGAELGLARSALAWWLAAALAAVVFAVTLGLTLLGLLAVVLAAWLQSWAAALAVLALLQVVLLAAAIALFRALPALDEPARHAARMARGVAGGHGRPARWRRGRCEGRWRMRLWRHLGAVRAAQARAGWRGARSWLRRRRPCRRDGGATP